MDDPRIIMEHGGMLYELEEGSGLECDLSPKDSGCQECILRENNNKRRGGYCRGSLYFKEAFRIGSRLMCWRKLI